MIKASNPQPLLSRKGTLLEEAGYDGLSTLVCFECWLFICEWVLILVNYETQMD